MKTEDKNGKNKEAWGVTRQGGNSQEMEYLGRDEQEKEWEVGGFLVTDADVKEVEKSEGTENKEGAHVN